MINSKKKCLSWIPAHKIINKCLKENYNYMDIVGAVSFNNNNSICQEVMFLNSIKHKSYSPLFSYTMKPTKTNDINYCPDNEIGPMYYENPLTKNCNNFWGFDKYNQYCVIGSENKSGNMELYTWNHITESLCPITFNTNIVKEDHDSCTDPKCHCHNKIDSSLKSCKKKLISLKKSFEEELFNLSKIRHMVLIDFTIIEECDTIIFAFSECDKISLVMFSFTVNSNKIILDRNPFKFDYNVSGILTGLTYDANNGAIFIAINYRDLDKSEILVVNWYNVLQSISYNINRYDIVDGNINSLSMVNGKLLLIYDELCLSKMNFYCSLNELK
jgi:hypothetical protein